MRAGTQELLRLHLAYLADREGVRLNPIAQTEATRRFVAWLELNGRSPSEWQEEDWRGFFTSLDLTDPGDQDALLESLAEWGGTLSGAEGI